MRVPFSEWLPDQPDLDNPGMTKANNVYPRTPSSYGPIKDLVESGNSLSGTCLGFTFAKSTTGNTTVFAGDANDLYELSATSWQQVTRLSDTSTQVEYSTGSGEFWRFAQYGDLMIATNYSDEIQQWTLDTSANFSNLSADAPKARYIAAIDPAFVMVANTNDTSDGAKSNRVWWSAIDSPTNWPTPGGASAVAVQSDYQDLPTGGPISGLLGAVGGATGAIICEEALYRFDYEGAGTVFRFTRIEAARGSKAPNSIINTAGPYAFYLGEDGFYRFNGTYSEPIGRQRVDTYFYDNLNTNYLNRVWATSDPLRKLVFWQFPSNSSTDGVADMILIYSWDLDRWSVVDGTQTQLLLRFASPGYTLEQLDDFSSNLDLLTPSLDDRFWSGGDLSLAAFTASKRVATFSGDNLKATLETSEFGTPGKRSYVAGVRPLVDGGAPTCSVGWRDDEKSPLTYTAPTSAGADGVCPQRKAARYMRAQVIVPAGSTWNHAQGVEPELRPEGRR